MITYLSYIVCISVKGKLIMLKSAASKVPLYSSQTFPKYNMMRKK